jgi:ABC-type Fe3+/spermidine/putrescine transport system ATPase subunit
MTRGEKPFLTLQGLSKSFGAVKVVANLDIEVRKGEFISLLGPSGCGKTTTLRMVAGFVSPDAGKIILEGERIDQMPSHKRGTAMVFQNYALFPHMTVAENIAFGLRMHKVPKPEITRRVGEALDLIRLRALEGRFPKELSGGQQQRVALARAIVLNPKILLLDEPLSNLDAKLRKELRAEFLEIHRVSGITTLFVTHDLEEAFSVSDRVAVMNQGRIEQYAPPVEIFTKPQTPFVAEFIGHSNVISGTLKVDGGEARLVSDGIEMAVKTDGAPGRAVRVAIPSHLIRIALSRLPLDNSFEARLRSVVYLGAMLQIEAEIGSIVVRAEVPANTDTLVMKAGDAIFVGWQRGDSIELPMATA